MPWYWFYELYKVAQHKFGLEGLFPLVLLQGGKRVLFPELVQTIQIYNRSIGPCGCSTLVFNFSPPREATHRYHPGGNAQVIVRYMV